MRKQFPLTRSSVMQSLSLLLTCCWTQHAALVSGRVCIADRLIQAEGRRRSASFAQNLAVAPASPTGQATPGFLAAEQPEEAGPAAAQPEEAVPAAAQPEEAMPAAAQPAEAMPADASSADTAAGLSAQEELSASSSVAELTSDKMYKKAVMLKHLVLSIQATDPLHNQEAAASWKGDMLKLAKLTCQLALCVGTDFPSPADDSDPLELARKLAIFCEAKFDKTSTSVPAPAPAPEAAAAAGIAPARISAVRPVSSHSAAFGDTSQFRNHFRRRPSRLGPAGGGSGG